MYSVVPVRCTETTCVSFVPPTNCGKECGAIGLTDDEKGGHMICHEYHTAFDTPMRDLKVWWERISSVAGEQQQEQERSEWK
jgi:hypothetical protein